MLFLIGKKNRKWIETIERERYFHYSKNSCLQIVTLVVILPLPAY